MKIYKSTFLLLMGEFIDNIVIGDGDGVFINNDVENDQEDTSILNQNSNIFMITIVFNIINKTLSILPRSGIVILTQTPEYKIQDKFKNKYFVKYDNGSIILKSYYKPDILKLYKNKDDFYFESSKDIKMSIGNDTGEKIFIYIFTANKIQDGKIEIVSSK